MTLYFSQKFSSKLYFTDGSGRTGLKGKSTPIIGSVILHDKLKYWQGDRSIHYHQGML